LNRYYCIKCRRKLEHESESQWHPASAELMKKAYARFNAWFCKACSIVYIFMGASGNDHPVIFLVKKEEHK